jgi:hypothetical protein
MVRAEQALLGKEKSTNSEFATSSSDPCIFDERNNAGNKALVK